jgi:hypothetical protein
MTLACAVVVVAGCSGNVQKQEPGPDHPANPNATQSPAPAPSQSLRDRSQMSAPAMYACPMHPDVTSTDPNAPCPKCGMKINWPVKRSTTAPAAPAHQHDHAGGGQ